MFRGVYVRPDYKSNDTITLAGHWLILGIEGEWPCGYNPRDDASSGQGFS